MRISKLMMVLFFLPLLFWQACGEGEFLGPKPLPFPEITTRGAGTFGCYVNGQAYVNSPSRAFTPTLPGCMYLANIDRFIVQGSRIDDSRYRLVKIAFEQIDSIGTYPLTGVVWDDSDNVCFSAHGLEEEHLLPTAPNEVNILRIDREEGIISGTFQFTVVDSVCLDTFRITGGRFDYYWLAL